MGQTQGAFEGPRTNQALKTAAREDFPSPSSKRRRLTETDGLKVTECHTHVAEESGQRLGDQDDGGFFTSSWSSFMDISISNK